jgi:hypothetical protein
VQRNLLRSLQAERRAASFTQLDQRILSIFYWWSVISVFIGAMLGGSIFSQFRVALEDPGALLRFIRMNAKHPPLGWAAA